MEKQVVSKKRVADHGEVLTAKREVNAMLDLVRQETERIESRFLEPACGTGNFLTEILERKLRVVESRYGKSQLEYERNAVLAMSSIYGIDILEDNVLECRKWLFDIFNQKYSSLFKKRAKDECRSAVKYILDRNITHGDALTLKTEGDNPRPIVFSAWSFPFHNSMIKRLDYTFADLIPSEQTSQRGLFSEPELYSDLGKRAFIPKEIQTFPPVHFLKIGEGYE
ncbi:MAG: SAM-dependent DNA methyltransferase [Chloroflexi bacterium]|nr:SAM-dependent DNA methyltransferase [Chloroflexota bacterium]